MTETTTNATADTCCTDTATSLGVKVRNAIAARTDTITDCEPLYNTIDPDALNAVFNSTSSPTERRGKVTFDYCGYHVTVLSDRTIELTPIDDG
ncbi:HalOD1 output domain-containing protein [Haladaptatus pallidirubidus]|uniref:Halobacterial output domain-containing protein n=1 Tax=Haladaptatus pallidirubidus TaxID=1008152 RepID=A0AAV3UPV6_9EURY